MYVHNNWSFSPPRFLHKCGNFQKLVKLHPSFAPGLRSSFKMLPEIVVIIKFDPTVMTREAMHLQMYAIHLVRQTPCCKGHSA